MYLGVWYNPFSWGQDILDNVISVIYGILLTLDCIIYSFVSYVYQIFLVLANGERGLIDDAFVGDLVSRVYIIIGVVMLFIVAYSLLKSMINTDDLTKGKNSPINIIKDILISIVLIALLPTVFDFAFQFQNSLLKNNTIGKLIVGNHGDANAENTIRKGGYTMAAGVFGAFMHANEGYCNEKAEEEAGKSLDGSSCEVIKLSDGRTYGELWQQAEEATTFWVLGDVAPKILSGEVSYYFLIAPAAGLFVLMVLITYCFDMALRLVKLSIFEVIAPLPILCRIVPNEQTKKVFSNWLKATISTFIEVFIRIAILYFAVFVISTIVKSFNDIFGTLFSGSARLDILLIAQALIIIGIIMFVKQAPDIIKEMTGLDSGKYGKSLLKGVGMLASSIGGGATAAIRSFTSDTEAGKDGSERLKRAFTAGLGASGRGVWHGSKIEKMGDIPKSAGTAASNTLSKRARVEAAGGYGNYLESWVNDTQARLNDWAGGSEASVRSEKEASDKLLKVVSNIKALAEDYVDKHASEFFEDAQIQAEFNIKAEALETAKKSGDQTAITQAQTELERFINANANQRLDVLKAMSEDTRLNAEERANALNRYNLMRKNVVDGFATTAHGHTGAEKEAAQISEELKTLQQLIKENKASLAVQYLLNGNDTHNLEAFTDELTNANAGKYLKAAKTAAEYANIDTQARINELDRRRERHKARKSDNGGK